MSWTDDMRCLYCDGKLPLYRKITSGQFCSAGHRKSYWQEQERLAVERLHQTHDSLRAYRPPEALESPLGKTSASEPLYSGRFYAPAADPSVPAFVESASNEELARSASNTGNVTFAGFLTEAKPELRPSEPLPLSAIDFAAWSGDGFWMPYGVAAASGELEKAGTVALTLFRPAMAAPAVRISEGKEGPAAFTSNLIPRISLAATPETPEFESQFLQELAEAAPAQPAQPEEPVFPLAETLFALPRIAARAAALSLRVQPLEAINAQPALEKTRYAAHLATPAGSSATRLLPLELGNAPVGRHVALQTDASRTAELTLSVDAPRMTVGMPALAPALRFAPGSRYPMSSREGKPADVKQALPVELRTNTAAPELGQRTEDVEPALSLAPGCRYHVSIRASQMTGAAMHSIAAKPEVSKTKLAIVPLPDGAGAADRAPGFRGMLPLAFHATPRVPGSAQAAATGVLYQYPANPPMQPVATGEPIEGELAPTPRTDFLAGWMQARQGTNLLRQATDFWQHAPRDLKLLAVAIPILLGLVLRPTLPKVRVAAPASSTQIQGSLERGFRERLMNVRRSVADRAGVALNEEFRTGLDDWQSRGDFSTAWSFDNTGFVKPGSLALYRPSMGLTNYDLEFLGLIDKKALSWVVRAKDFDNYYVVKLVILKPGPLPTIGITRYAVVNGKAQDRVDTIAPINARPDMLYRVSMNISDDSYLLTLQGIVVDHWTDSRLKSGGVGFFSPRGEESRVRWVQVTHQYDMLGRLCAYLAPYNIPTTNGSW